MTDDAESPSPWRLRTARLGLRELGIADASALIRLNQHPDVARFTGDGPLADIAAAIEVIESRILPQYRRHGLGRWAVVGLDDGELLGWCGLKYLADDDEYDIGYRFMAEHWGRGYATESAAAVLEYGRAHLGGARIAARVAVENLASVRVLEKIGLHRERIVDQDGAREAVYVDRAPRGATVVG